MLKFWISLFLMWSFHAEARKLSFELERQVSFQIWKAKKNWAIVKIARPGVFSDGRIFIPAVINELSLDKFKTAVLIYSSDLKPLDGFLLGQIMGVDYNEEIFNWQMGAEDSVLLMPRIMSRATMIRPEGNSLKVVPLDFSYLGGAIYPQTDFRLNQNPPSFIISTYSNSIALDPANHWKTKFIARLMQVPGGYSAPIQISENVTAIMTGNRAGQMSLVSLEDGETLGQREVPFGIEDNSALMKNGKQLFFGQTGAGQKDAILIFDNFGKFIDTKPIEGNLKHYSFSRLGDVFHSLSPTRALATMTEPNSYIPLAVLFDENGDKVCSGPISPSVNFERPAVYQMLKKDDSILLFGAGRYLTGIDTNTCQILGSLAMSRTVFEAEMTELPNSRILVHLGGEIMARELKVYRYEIKE